MAKAGREFQRLLDIMLQLRAPDGCPWDREQTLKTLRPFVLEETYEVLEAIDHDDRGALREELGDFVFEAVLLAQLCTETGDFTVADSLRSISRQAGPTPPARLRPRRRRRGVAGTDDAGRGPRTLGTPEGEGASQSGTPRTTLGGVPTTLPALLRAYEIGVRAAAVGFDWERAVDVVAKIEEEVAELRETIESGGPALRERAEEEMGDLLFAIANLSRKLGIEPESALRQADEKFT